MLNIGIIASSILKSTVIGSGILDLYPSAGGYSLQKLKDDAVYGIRVRRSNDNAGTDVELKDVDNGSIDLSSIVSAGGTLGDWVGGNDAFIRTWYDQSGNGNDFIQTSSTLQPRIVSLGVLDVKNALSAIDFRPTNKRLNIVTQIPSLNSGNSFTIYTVSSERASNTNGGIICTTDNTFRFVMFRDARTQKNNGLIQTSGGLAFATLNTSRIDTNQVLQIVSCDGSSISSWDNELTGDANQGFTSTYNNDNLHLGSQHGNATPLDGFIQEIIIRAEEDLTTNREAIRDDINSRYSIY